MHSGRAIEARVWPPDLVAAILLGLCEQLEHDGKLDLGSMEVGPHDEEPTIMPEDDQEAEEIMQAVDDVNGGFLDV